MSVVSNTQQTSALTANIDQLVLEYMKEYSAEVVNNRAVPDLRDGLKPVQRHILWSMHNLGITHTKTFRKSAFVVGDTMGKYHAHGDLAIYETMVNMVNSRYPLIQGQGNWGGLDKSQAAMRYTECRLTKLAEYAMSIIPVAPYVPNYDGTTKVPLVIPSRAPLGLMNGSAGIAVGVSLNIPPHNLGELIAAIRELVANSKISTKKILKHIKGPDYALGGTLLSSREEVENLYTTGKGTLKFSCGYNIEQTNKGGRLITTSPAPYFNVTKFKELLISLKKTKAIKEFKDRRSKKTGFQFVIEFDNSYAIEKFILPALTTSVSYQFYGLIRNTEQDIELYETNLHEMLKMWLDSQRNYETQYTKYVLANLKKELDRVRAKISAHINIDAVAKILKSGKERKSVIDAFMKKFGWTEDAANYIADSTVISLSKSNLNSLVSHKNELKKSIKKCKSDLKDIDVVILRELDNLTKFADDRRTLVNIKTTSNFDNSKIYVYYNSTSKPQGMAKVVVDCATLTRNTWNDGCSLAEASQGFWVVYSSGVLRKFEPPRPGDLMINKEAIAVISGKAKRILLVDTNGQGIIYQVEGKKQRELRTLQSSSNPVVMAYGLFANDTIIARSDKYEAILNPKLIKKRSVARISKTNNLIPHLKSTKRSLKIWVIGRRHTIIVNSRVTTIEKLKGRNFSVQSKFNIFVNAKSKRITDVGKNTATSDSFCVPVR